MSKLILKSKKDFVSNFLGPVSNLNEMCVLKLYKDKIECTIAGADSTIVGHAQVEIESDITEDSIVLNIPDIKKLIRVLDIIPDEQIELKLNNNNISYSKNGYKFKFHLIEDDVIRLPKVNINKINSLKFDSFFTVKENALSTVFKGSSFTTETTKFYLYGEDDKVMGELGDRNRHNTDNFGCIISETCDGSPITKPIPLNFESFRLISFNGSKEIQFKVNQEMGVLVCELKKGNTSLIYVMSALIN